MQRLTAKTVVIFLLIALITGSDCGVSAAQDDDPTKLELDFPELKIVATRHYWLGTDFEGRGVDEVARLLDRFHSSFFEFWSDRGWQLEPAPQRPVVIVCHDRERFRRYQANELGEGAAPLDAFYSLKSHRVYVLFAAHTPTTALTTSTTTAVPPTFSTDFARNLIHESTHQLMVHGGMQPADVDYPLWVSEGLATYFESIDESTSLHWRRPGGRNSVRFDSMPSIDQLDEAALQRMITDDSVFRDREKSSQMYAMAWGYCSFLLRRHPERFASYLQELARSNRCADAANQANQRLSDYRLHCGDESQLVEEYRRFIPKLK